MLQRVQQLVLFFAAGFGAVSARAELKVQDSAPLFEATLHNGSSFALKSRLGNGWTVLYFYPKAETPGCTKQACAFRDSIKKITDLKAAVYGISSDTQEAQAQFHEHHHLNFDLIADPNHKVIDLYQAKMPLIGMAKRWTFVLDPELKIRTIDRDVDPVKDADKVAAVIAELQKKK